MRISFRGLLVDEPEIRAGFIGCGSHAFRNIFPTFQFAPVRLTATCDLSPEKAEAFATQFGAARSYSDHREMLDKEDLDAVFIVTGYDDRGRPQYPYLAIDCLEAGCHVWTEKPISASCEEVTMLKQMAQRVQRNVVIGYKTMFMPANEKARELSLEEDFGQVTLVTVQYPQSIPATEDLERYLAGDNVESAVGFLDHICHPLGIIVAMLGMPKTLYYTRGNAGAGVACFTYESGVVVSLAFSYRMANNGGIERSLITSDRGRHILVDNNWRLSYHRDTVGGYGDTPSYFGSQPGSVTSVWEPEFSLGQLYNKGLFLLGYYNEVNEFARSIIDNSMPRNGTLEQAWQITRIFEAFAYGPDRVISLL